MAITAPLDFTLSYSFTCKNPKPPYLHSSSSNSCCGRIFTKTPFPFVPNLSSRPLKASSSACSPPVLDGDAPATVPESHAETNHQIISLFKDPQTQSLGYDRYQRAAQNPCFRPHRRTLKLVSRHLARSQNWAALFSFCEDLRRFRVFPERVCCYKLIGACVRARKVRLVNALLDVFASGGDAKLAVSAFDSAMRGYNKLHMYSSTGGLYQRMKSSGLDLSPACCSRAMEAATRSGRYEEAVSIFRGFDSGKMGEGVEVGMVSVYERIYWCLCESLGKLGRAEEALELFREMSKVGVQGNYLIYSSLITCFATRGRLEIAEELLREAESKSMLRDPEPFFKLILRYIEEGQMEKTLDIVGLMKRAKINVSDVIFSAIVNGFSKKRGFKDAKRVYEDILLQGCEPGQVTYASAMKVYFRLELYDRVEAIFSEMEEKGYLKCVVAYATMIATYSKMGKPSEAMRVVAKMKNRGCEPNLWVYNTLLDMNGKAQNLRRVEKTWKEMKRKNIVPDHVSYTSVIHAYYNSREFEMCVKYYEEFKMTGGKIDKAMAGVMIPVLAKTNRVDKVVELLQDIRTQGTRMDGRFYRSALLALRDAGLEAPGWLEEMFRHS